MTGLVVAALVVASFDLKVGPEAREVSVEARYTQPSRGCYQVDEAFSSFVDAVETRRGERWRPVPREGACFRLEPKGTGEARVRYRYRLAEATARDRFGVAWENPRGVRLFLPSILLLRPARAPAEGDFRLVVDTPPDVVFASGLERVADRTYEGRARFLEFAPYSLLGAAEEWHTEVGGARQDVVVVGSVRERPRADLERWVTRAATAVSGYLGRFPIPRLQIVLVPGRRDGVGYGTTWGFGGASIVMNVGPGRRADLDADWELTHEMVHLALSNLPRAQRWMEEGLATYGETVSRTAAGQRTETDLWQELVKRLPEGQPKEGDQGLDLTHTWARTYWGGALFWFVADVRLREKTKEALGLPDLLRRLADEGHDIRTEESAASWLHAADRLSGETVVSEVYAELAAKPGRVDLDALWKQLGVADGGNTLDDEAPLAAIRRDLTRRPGGAR